MNFELITKLAKLANNNPNDNEANAAARKVCKLLAEADFKFEKDTIPPPEPRAQRQENPFSTEDLYDILRNMGNRHYAYGFDYDGPRYRNSGGVKGGAKSGESDRERRRRDENAEREYRQSEEYRRRQRDAEMHQKAEQAKRQKDRGFDYTKEKVLRQCSKCGITKLTASITEVFVCNECLWR